MKTALTYDDIQLIPRKSSINSREDISLKTRLSERYSLINPFVASCMDTVCEYEMAYRMYQYGGVGCIHRFMSIDQQADQISKLSTKIKENPLDLWGTLAAPIFAAIGVNWEIDRDRAKQLVQNGANVLLIDVAHGHHTKVLDMIDWCKSILPKNIDIIAGNIATSEAAIELQDHGVNGLRVGIGGGCFTPNMEVKTNNGLKQISEIKINDFVLTHTGKYQRVINKFEYNKNEEITIINGIESTNNHEYYVVHKKYKNIITDDNIINYAMWIRADELTDEYLLIER